MNNIIKKFKFIIVFKYNNKYYKLSFNESNKISCSLFLIKSLLQKIQETNNSFISFLYFTFL